jgi:hypothetical protein
LFGLGLWGGAKLDLGDGPVLPGSTCIWLGLLLVLLGITQIGLGQLFFCIRDMARNSFYLRRLA